MRLLDDQQNSSGQLQSQKARAPFKRKVSVARRWNPLFWMGYIWALVCGELHVLLSCAVH